jgi:hypothetical protein
MGEPIPLRPELASVCRFLGIRAGRTVAAAAPKPPLCGILADLAAVRGSR